MPLITGLPAGPTGQLAFQGGWIYWGAGATTNSGVVSKSDGGALRAAGYSVPGRHPEPEFVRFGRRDFTSGYSLFDHRTPAVPCRHSSTPTPARFDRRVQRRELRAPLDDMNAIEPFSWGYRNGYAVRFAPDDHPLAGGLLVGENGADDAGARPSNNAPDSLHLARQNPDGSPDYHGWPDRYGFLPTSQAVFNPIGGPAEDLCVFDASNPPSNCTPASLAQILSEDVPIRDVLAARRSRSRRRWPLRRRIVVHRDRLRAEVLYSRTRAGGCGALSLEGDFGFSADNASPPAPEIGHEIQLINFSGEAGQPAR